MSMYIDNIPTEIKFSEPYEDGSGDRLSVKLEGDGTLYVGDHMLFTRVKASDVEWYADELRDVQKILTNREDMKEKKDLDTRSKSEPE